MIDLNTMRNVISLDHAPDNIIDCQLLISGLVHEDIVDSIKKL